MVAEKADQSEAQKGQTPAEVKKEPTKDSKPDEAPKADTFKKPAPPAKNESDLEEQKPEVTTSTSEEVQQSKTSEDATLILSAEEEAEIAAQTNEDAVKEQTQKTTTPAKKKKAAQKNVWVSNISRGTKAADLKKLFSESFKVESAKIVTNGKSFFGYICLESPEMAEKSVKELDGSELNGRKITITLMRPDLKAARSNAADARRSREIRREPRVSNGAKKTDGDEGGKAEAKDEVKKEGDDADADKDAKESSDDKKIEDTPEEKLKRQLLREERNKRLIQDLKADLARSRSELQNIKRQLNNANRREASERERKNALRRDMENLEGQLKSERRRFTQDIEQMEKKRKMFEIRYQDDRAVLNKELDECKKVREYLERKIEENRRSSPRRGMPNKMGRSRMHPSDGRGGRSPPPPPKINSRRSPRDNSPSSYKGGKKPRLDDSSYGNNHYQGQGPAFSGGAKPLLGHYPQSGSSGGPPRNAMYASTAYPEPHRYGSSGYPSGGYSMGGNPAPLMSRPMGYPDVRGGQRKY